ncbi:MAG: hypothetical protein RL077_3814 [Verrucomicrobiota bacterium]|jgi:nitrate/nitrite transport system substrate-binding protein
MTPAPFSPSTALNRRQFLTRASAGVGATAFFSALGTRIWAAIVGGASDAPETPNLNFGMIALTDCSPIVIAHEKGLFKKYGINSTVTKGANWAAIRDNLSSGSIQATHMLIGMPLASTMGLLGAPKSQWSSPGSSTATVRPSPSRPSGRAKSAPTRKPSSPSSSRPRNSANPSPSR